MEAFNGINNMVFLKNYLCNQLHCTKDELDFKSVTIFSLEHVNLQKISCLWPLSNLTRLNLSNNSIKKIENLESLTQLKELNLSFNQISKIENLDTFVYLNKLLLQWNRIQLLENLDKLENLKILNVGGNCIRDKYFPFYLCQFKLLKAVITDPNPCYDEVTNEIDVYLIASMPQLSDLNYRKVTEKERYKAIMQYKLKVNGLKKIHHDFFEKKKEVQREPRTEVKKENAELFCNLIYPDFDVLIKLSNEGENFRRLNDSFEKNLAESSQSLRNGKNDIRNYFQNFQNTYDDLKGRSLDTQKRYMRELRDFGPNLDDKRLFDYRMLLIGEECETQHRLEKLLKEMESGLTKVIVEFQSNLKSIFDRLREEIEAYVKTMTKNIENCYQKKVNIPYGFNATSTECHFFANIDLNKFFQVFRGNCTTVIDEFENTNIRESNGWRDKFTKINRENLVRHRKALAEIINSIETLTSERES